MQREAIEPVQPANTVARDASEALLLERLSNTRKTARLLQALTSLRWWAVADLCWMLREALEPARYALSYPSSWAYKLSAMSSHPMLSVIWFSLASALIFPLIVTLAIVPRTIHCQRSERLAFVGLFMAGTGYAVLATFAARIDVPHVVDSYRGSCCMLLVTGLLVACWHNARMVRAEREALECRCEGGPSCDVLAL